MTIDELKAEAAKLPPSERSALAKWIESNDDVRETRRAILVRDIQEGVAQLESGAFTECKTDSELRSFFDRIKARGRERVANGKKSAA